MVIRVKINTELHEEILWIWELFADYIGFQTETVTDDPHITISESGGDITLSHFFRNTYLQGDKNWKSYFRNELMHYTSSGQPDYLSTAYYLVNCLQEYDAEFEDEYGRFPYETSLQSIFHCMHHNVVGRYFDALYDATPKLKELVQRQEKKTKFFLTHDIDSLYGAYPENRKYLLKHKRFGDLLRVMFNHYIGTPDWMLLDRIMKIENEYDVKSVFFWLVNEGMGRNKIMNADYRIGNRKVQKLLASVSQNGYENALHKSSSRMSYSQELRTEKKLLPYNRNHFLKISLPDTFDHLEKNNILLDSSLGFSGDYGFRNSYGLPFRPFHVMQKKRYNFVEVPLHIMDTSFKYYLKMRPSGAKKEILSFLDANRNNCVLTILWHNNYFSGYYFEGWLEVYKAILGFIRDNQMQSITGKEIVDSYL